MLNTITIIGLGINPKPDIPLTLLPLLKSVKKVYTKFSNSEILTQIVSSVKYISPKIDTVDNLTDGYSRFVTDLVKITPAVYLVPGNPLIDEASLPLIKKAATKAGISVEVIEAEDMLSYTIKQLRLCPGGGLQLLDATILGNYHHPPLEPDRPTLISGIYDGVLLEVLKERLQTIYDLETVVRGVEFGERTQVIETKLADLNSLITALYIPPQANGSGLSTFQETIAHLRAPDGCPWDKEQTHQSLRPYLLEETYEVLAALDENNMTELADELGDLLLQIVLHAQIASEAKSFKMKDIINHINEKIVRRHPHVFGDISVNNSEEVRTNWAAIKAKEKAAKGQVVEKPSVLDGVQKGLPALAQALDVSEKAVKVGFEWQQIDGVLEKLVEEAHEIATATSAANVEAEIGDFLFTAVNVARKLGVNAEDALRACNMRFIRRFKMLEQLADKQGLILSELDKAMWQALWGKAKEKVAHLE